MPAKVGPLRAEDGARFRAAIDETSDGPQATYLVALDVGNETLTETDIQLFGSREEARAWLDAEAARRGF
jgi:hypothetical protein